VSQKRAFVSADLATNRIEQFYLDLAVVDPCVFQRAFSTPERPDAVDARKELRLAALYGRDIQRLPPAIQYLDFVEDCALFAGEGHGGQHQFALIEVSAIGPICRAYSKAQVPCAVVRRDFVLTFVAQSSTSTIANFCSLN
jgi:hypothetical protein